MENSKSEMAKKKYRVLIVDDDNMLLNMYSIKFQKEGLVVDTATNSKSALQKLKEGIPPDILIIDIVMPSMDGFELLAEIRKEKLAENAVVIFLTNQSQTVDIEHAKKLGVDGYIVKASSIPSEVLREVLAITHDKKEKNE